VTFKIAADTSVTVACGDSGGPVGVPPYEGVDVEQTGGESDATHMGCDANGRNIGDVTSNEISLLGSSITPGATIRCYAIVR
jgi:hypothetical protein